MSSQQPRFALAGSEHAVEAGTTAGAVLAEAGLTAAGTTIAARVNGELRDLAYRVADGDVVEPVDIDSDDGRYILRHSTAHVMAQAVQELFPQAKLGIGPPVENGFYYDFDVDQPFTPDDLKAIEARMRQIVKQGQLFSRRVVTDEEARAELADEPYKLELIGLKGHPSSEDGESVEVGGAELTIYDNLDPGTGELCWNDLCRGPHLPDTRKIPAFKLMRSGGAYWRGSEKNPQLQRIYGTAWETRERQDEYLKMMAEAERRDHRKLGAELDLFSFPVEIGSGLPVFHPKGGIIRRVMEDYSRRRHDEAGYEFVNTPHLTKADLFVTSGHLEWYADGHVPADGAGRRYLLPEADELPDAHPDLRIARPFLPRAAPAAVRVRHRVPVREVRRGARPDPGPRLHPGRLAHLLLPRAAARRARVPACLRGRAAARLRADRVRGRAVHPAGQVRRRAGRMGRGRGGTAARA